MWPLPSDVSSSPRACSSAVPRVSTGIFRFRQFNIPIALTLFRPCCLRSRGSSANSILSSSMIDDDRQRLHRGQVEIDTKEAGWCSLISSVRLDNSIECRGFKERFELYLGEGKINRTALRLLTGSTGLIRVTNGRNWKLFRWPKCTFPFERSRRAADRNGLANESSDRALVPL